VRCTKLLSSGSEPGSLLEQHTTDVFSTSLGNIGAREGEG